MTTRKELMELLKDLPNDETWLDGFMKRLKEKEPVIYNYMIESAKKQALEKLEAVLCDPEGKCCIQGADADRLLEDEAIAALRQTIAEAEKQEPVSWVELHKEADQIVRSKVLWKRFIDGTPLANDVACWMADFAIQYAKPKREWVGLGAVDFNDFNPHFKPEEAAKWAENKLKEKNT